MNKLLIALCCLVICSCQSYESRDSSILGKHTGTNQSAEILEGENIPRTSTPPKPPELSLEKGSKIIRNGDVKFEVGELETAKRKVDSILNSVNGYYENEVYKAYGNRLTYTLKLRIPNLKFDSLVNQLEKGIGELKSKNISAKDVTEEYVDINIRLENNLSYLKQYKSILSKAKTIKEILEVQEKIRRIEAEIESKKGRLKFLDDRVNFSTLNIELSELISGEFSKMPGFGHRIVNAFNDGAQGFLTFLVFLVNIWPFLILLLLFFLGRKPLLRRFGRKKNT